MANQPGVESSNESQYFGPACQFKFRGGAIAWVPREVIDKYPNFAGSVYTQQPIGQPIKFDVTGRVGHTIVHSLFTGTYQTLPPPVDEKAKEPSGAFIEALEVYQQAEIYGLEDLAELATEEIARQGKGESFASIVKGVCGVDEMWEGDKIWLGDYLASRATMTHEEVTEEDIQKLQFINQAHPLVDILLEANMKLKFQLQQAEEELSEASSM
ncbi:hypothetical protein FSOLCH5_004598 [Fusarium solani]|uniref:Uncharacterized protein n=1 Tax=Fusarium solani TaxID=169388 RepID=A0A9P9L0E3_FUSSL|nr:uncharacterized protein B0J15DRAFT_461756 [Fusarium solani]KAH7271736.1 hypothetical protein B0J15DRAFT_461756 [Fusarium solani]KAJ3466952.1 hypothetical protein MRS44_004516 [Fusarium solani]